MMLVVVTPLDVKLYRMKDGFMQILHTNLFEDTQTILSTFVQDKRHRKCYISTNKGLVKVFNIYNGISLKTIIEKEEIFDNEIKFKRLKEMSKRPVRPVREINDM